LTPKTTRLLDWDGPLPEPGHFLQTDAGSTYLVLSVRPNERPAPKSVAFLQLGKLERGEDLPVDAVVHGFAWAARPKTRRAANFSPFPNR
jgi:hypothetical protein